MTMDEESMKVYQSADSYGEPDIKSLMNLVVAKIPGLWYDVGIQLTIPIGILDGFKMDISLGGESKNYFRQTLVYWCKNHPSPYKWSVLLSSLASPSIGQKKIAEEIFTTLKMVCFTLIIINFCLSFLFLLTEYHQRKHL